MYQLNAIRARLTSLHEKAIIIFEQRLNVSSQGRKVGRFIYISTKNRLPVHGLVYYEPIVDHRERWPT